MSISFFFFLKRLDLTSIDEMNQTQNGYAITQDHEEFIKLKEAYESKI